MGWVILLGLVGLAAWWTCASGAQREMAREIVLAALLLLLGLGVIVNLFTTGTLPEL